MGALQQVLSSYAAGGALPVALAFAPVQATVADGSAGLALTFPQALTAGQVVVVLTSFDDSATDSWNAIPILVGGSAVTLDSGATGGSGTVAETETWFTDAGSGQPTGGETGVFMQTVDAVTLNATALVFNNFPSSTPTLDAASTADGTSLSITPTGASLGIAVTAVGNAANPTFATPSGWTRVATIGQASVWQSVIYKIGTAGTVAPSWTTHGPASSSGAGWD